jgi:hypothetical protein
MSKLQVEELESRQLLNGSGNFPPLPRPPFLATFTHSFVMLERTFAIDYENHVGAFDWGWFDRGRADISLLRIFFSSGPGGRDAVLPSLSREALDGTETAIASGDLRIAADHFALRPGAAGSAAAAFLPNAAVPPAPLDPPGNAHAVNAAAAGAIAAILSERPDLQPRPAPGNLGGGSSLPALQALLSQRSPGYPLSVREDGPAHGGSFTDETARRYSESGTAVNGDREGGFVLPAPQASGALAMLPPFGLSDLEVDMQEFLQQLERLAPHLASDRDGAELWPWIVAMAAATVACEIARRELRRPPDLSTIDTKAL